MSELLKAIPPDWESQLEPMVMQNQGIRRRRNAYIASPCSAATNELIRQNMRAARLYLYYAHKYLNLNAWAPHAYLPAMLNDNDLLQRAIALRFGLELLKNSDRFLLCGSRLSKGMESELIGAARSGMPIRVYSPILHKEADGVLRELGLDVALIYYDEKHPLLALSSEDLFAQEVPYV